MADTYNDDARATQAPQQLPVIPPQKQQSAWDWVSRNRKWVIIGIIVLIALVWWFCLRKPNVATATTNVTVPAGTRTETLKLTKVKGNSA